MLSKKILLLVVVLAIALAIPAVVLAALGRADATAKPPTKIEAEFTFKDTGSKLTITGTAEGLEPGHSYVSLIYGPGSDVTGIHACEPTDGGLGSRMFVGSWTVAADGTGTLGPVSKKGEGYVSLSEIGTISVRAGIPAGPGSIPVVACGAVD